jgi:hypothetical protein
MPVHFGQSERRSYDGLKAVDAPHGCGNEQFSHGIAAPAEQNGCRPVAVLGADLSSVPASSHGRDVRQSEEQIEHIPFVK